MHGPRDENYMGEDVRNMCPSTWKIYAQDIFILKLLPDLESKPGPGSGPSPAQGADQAQARAQTVPKVPITQFSCHCSGLCLCPARARLGPYIS